MPTLTLSMIVKNEEKALARCLDSVRGVVNEIVIADTGSTDRSMEIAGEYGARVFSIAWDDDFAKARNASLAHATSDWVLMLDADEMLDPDAAKVLPAHLGTPGIMGYTVTIRNYVRDLNFYMWDQKAKPNKDRRAFVSDYPGYVDHVNARLFRRDPEIYFKGQVHESVGYRLFELGMRMDQAEFMIHHFGFLEQHEVQANKAIFYRSLGREKVRDMPEVSLAHFELGVEEALHFHRYEEAAEHFHKAAQLNPRFGPAWLYYGRMLAVSGKHREALEAYARAEDTTVNRAMLLELQGDSHYTLGEYEATRRCYRELIESEGDNPAIESKLGFAEVRLGLTAQGLARLRAAIEAAPENLEAHDRLIAAFTWLGRLDEAAVVAEGKLEAVEPQPEYFLRAASVHAQMGRWNRVLELVERGLERFPDDARLRQAIAEGRSQTAIAEAANRGDAAFRANDFAAACHDYRDALDGLGDAPVVESKLGIAEVRSGLVEQGLARLREAARKQAQSPEIHDRLIAACLETGRLTEAIEAAENKLRKTDSRPEAYVLAASLCAKTGNWQRASTLAREGLDRFPSDEKLHQLAAAIEKLGPPESSSSGEL